MYEQGNDKCVKKHSVFSWWDSITDEQRRSTDLSGSSNALLVARFTPGWERHSVFNFRHYPMTNQHSNLHLLLHSAMSSIGPPHRAFNYCNVFFCFSVVSALLAPNIGFQLQYQLIFVLWLLSFDPRIAQRMTG